MTIDDRDQAGRTPLHYAAIDGPRGMKYVSPRRDPVLAESNRQKANDFKVANTTKLLADGADVNAADEQGFAALHFAANADSVDVVRLLLDAGADINGSNEAGETPLYIAVKNTTPGALGIMKLLRERGADPTIATQQGSTALSFVQRYGKPEEREVFADLLPPS